MGPLSARVSTTAVLQPPGVVVREHQLQSLPGGAAVVAAVAAKRRQIPASVSSTLCDMIRQRLGRTGGERRCSRHS